MYCLRFLAALFLSLSFAIAISQADKTDAGDAPMHTDLASHRIRFEIPVEVLPKPKPDPDPPSVFDPEDPPQDPASDPITFPPDEPSAFPETPKPSDPTRLTSALPRSTSKEHDNDDLDLSTPASDTQTSTTIIPDVTSYVSATANAVPSPEFTGDTMQINHALLVGFWTLISINGLAFDLPVNEYQRPEGGRCHKSMALKQNMRGIETTLRHERGRYSMVVPRSSFPGSPSFHDNAIINSKSFLLLSDSRHHGYLPPQAYPSPIASSPSQPKRQTARHNPHPRSNDHPQVINETRSNSTCSSIARASYIAASLRSRCTEVKCLTAAGYRGAFYSCAIGDDHAEKRECKRKDN